MTGEGKLEAGGEDPDAGIAGRRRRIDEDRLGQVELAGDGLEEVDGKAPRIGEDGEGVAAEGTIGEDVTGHVTEGHRPRLLPSPRRTKRSLHLGDALLVSLVERPLLDALG